MRLNDKTIKKIMGKHKKKDLAAGIGISSQLMSYYFREPATIHKANRIAEALSALGKPITAKDIVDW